MITLSDIEDAAATIKGQVLHTPLVPSGSLSPAGKASVFLKLENQQTTGSFKLRGASNAVSRLGTEDRKSGIVCVSTGNHGRGLAFAARQNGLTAIVCMGSLVPQNKIDGIKALGAEVRIVGDNQDDAQVEADRLVSEEGMTMIPPFDHLDIIAGQGTISLEVMQDLEEIDTVIVPMSGGGLLAGVASAVKLKNPGIRVIGVSMDRGCAMHLSLAAGEPVEVGEFPTLADALGGGIGPDNKYTLKLVQEFVDETVLVSEQEIADAIRHAYFEEQQIVEGSGSVGIAALLTGKVQLNGNTVVVISGRNIDMKKHQQLINGQMPNLD